MASFIEDPRVARAVSSIASRSEREPDVTVLQKTYVETGILPQLENHNNQILYGRRGTGKTHVLQVLGQAFEQNSGSHSMYIDIRLLGSSHLFTDTTRPIADRCIAVFKDFLGLLQSRLLDIATHPESDGSGLQEVSDFAEYIAQKSVDVAKRNIKDTSSAKSTDGLEASLKGSISGSLEGGLKASDSHEKATARQVEYEEALRESLVFSEVHQKLNITLAAMKVDHLILLIDEWTSLPVEIQPFIAEFIRRSLFTSNRITVKIASLEYRSRFTLTDTDRNIIGFELGADIAANLDLDDFYVYDRNREKVVTVFHELLYKHVTSDLDPGILTEHNIKDATSFRVRLFTEPATFVELVRAGEGVVRDFLGIFSAAFFKALTTGRPKIDLHSVEEAARDWYETDKSTSLSTDQREALHRIIQDVIGSRQTKMFMLSRADADHPMIQTLFDLRLLHLILRGYSDKENPGKRYNIYALDYGTYIDLKRTKAEPQGLFEVDDDTESKDSDDGKQAPEDRLVPFKDKRSIRRVILHTSVFDGLQ
ncbi:hypothetical protein [Mycobacterium kiyosense]|uniref:Uncharacterized protein n=2 Tax=Mycobacterium TaxID=1763 RepID=A0A9P3Q798_9MYCO|nr:hypothetical protein [Mycobacterium kiyosense]BDB41770.1 hypothetical protein IWGMT90018_22160 [Mycobacterium kiyosense]GLB82309.1 hypothetical protein SRL2020028_15650 [Mycobacterium kiyosense]GLB89360.1 hypothetical protein SRL2020130_21770 [Mycobacterium kiyosense]GLB96013.1 hypothetical protein SRL2020226_27890 [Mycobacterium kiyosense]GLC01582.1 hypothetical protein SRL2020400_21730 [Mycobacterium kiyosense]